MTRGALDALREIVFVIDDLPVEILLTGLKRPLCPICKFCQTHSYLARSRKGHWSFQDSVDTVTMANETPEVTSAQQTTYKRRSAKVRVHQEQPEREQRSNDVPLAECSAERLLRVAHQAGL